MDELAFKYPKKVLKILLIGSVLIAVGWGVITGNSQNAVNLLTKEITFITKPIFNYTQKRVERFTQPALDQMKESGNSASQDQ